jgi:peptidoglycan/xylan/chitin deacetylase (PgdA/CDA1 family)
MAILIANFEQQIQYLKKNYTLISFEEAVEMMEQRAPIPSNALVITFDDGYRDNYQNAFPILDYYKIPATIFLSVDVIEKGTMLWFDWILEGLRYSKNKVLDMRPFYERQYTLGGMEEALNIGEEIIRHGKELSTEKRDEYVQYILEALGITAAELTLPRIMMQWQEIKEMHRRGISFGNHGMTHTILSRLCGKALEQEIARGKEIMLDRIGVAGKVFAYPNGRPGDWTKEAKEVLRRHGYCCACTLLKGSNYPGYTDSYLLRRVAVTRGLESDVFGRFSKPLFSIMLERMFQRGEFLSVGEKKRNSYARRVE